MRFVALLSLFAIIHSASAQDGLNKRPDVVIDDNCHGYLEYLPHGYTGGTEKYPLLIFINGLGSTGDGSYAALEAEFSGGGYPHERQRAGNWPDSFLVGSTYRQLLCITPQFILPMWNRFPSVQEINDVINYSIAHYRIDTTRIYLMGASQGGGPVWEYPSYSSAYANRIAAIVPFAGVSYPFQEKSNIMKYANVRIWAFHNLHDADVPASFTIDYVDFYNNPPVPAIPAKKTIFDAYGHNVGFLPMMGYYTEDGMDVYQWMLQYQRTPTTAFAGEDQEIAVPASSVTLSAGGTAPDGTVASYQWQKISGPASGTFSNTAIANPTVTGLSKGTYIFRVTLTGNNNSTATDDVAITVNPGAQRIQAENYTAAYGVIPTPTTDEPGGIMLNAIDSSDWMEYSITVPSSAVYRFRFRAGSFYGASKLRILDHSGTLLDTMNVYGTWHWDSLMNMYVNIPLQAGTQTIRIQNAGNLIGQPWYFNWFEVIDDPVSAIVLPVNFTLFNAHCINNGVQLIWKTEGESGTRDFTVEKSTDGRTWNRMATLPAASQSNTERSYSWRDNDPRGQGYYRIVETDLDGRTTISSIIRSDCGLRASMNVFPNPVADKAIVSITLDQASRVSFRLVDLKGAVVRSRESMLPAGNSQVPFSMKGLPKGNYVLMARWENTDRAFRIVKN